MAPERVARPSDDGLRELFGLTSAEAKLAVALSDGETQASYSQLGGVSLNTVKTHLKHVFEKTGEKRKADLMRRITRDSVLRLG